jgi:hypothetical protein
LTLLLVGGDFASAALARDAAVPCKSLDPDAERVLRVGGDLDADAGLGLAEPSLSRAGAGVRAEVRLDRLSAVEPDGAACGLLVLARNDAVGLEGVPVI